MESPFLRFHDICSECTAIMALVQADAASVPGSPVTVISDSLVLRQCQDFPMQPVSCALFGCPSSSAQAYQGHTGVSTNQGREYRL